MVRQPVTRAPLVVAVATRQCERAVRWYTDVLSGGNGRHVCYVAVPDRGGAAQGFVPAVLRHLASTQPLALVVCQWFADQAQVTAMLRLARELGVPMVAVRPGAQASVARVVIATAGGPNTMELLWTAREIAAALGVSIGLLHWCAAGNASPSLRAADAAMVALERLGVRLLGFRVRHTVCRGTDCIQDILNRTEPDDLLVLGAPSSLRLAAGFAKSLPDSLAQRTAQPVILLARAPARRVSLRSLFWGGLIMCGMRGRDPEKAVSALAGNLVFHHRLPAAARAELAAHGRAAVANGNAVIDSETAFVHLLLPGVAGVAGSMGVCPDGLAFDACGGEQARFVFLLVSAEGRSDSYLSALAAIAARMIRADVRRALLHCRTSAQALAVLEPRTGATAAGVVPALASQDTRVSAAPTPGLRLQAGLTR